MSHHEILGLPPMQILNLLEQATQHVNLLERALAIMTPQQIAIMLGKPAPPPRKRVLAMPLRPQRKRR